MENPEIWRDADAAAVLRRERARLDGEVSAAAALEGKIAELSDLAALAESESDSAMLSEIAGEAAAVRDAAEELNLRRLFDGEYDAGGCFLTVQSGAGGVEAQDWAGMLFRMYLRYADSKSYSAEVLEESKGETAGLKSATVKIGGDYVYGNLRGETGVHRLVRKSPFDANRRRHTSFASVFVSPQVSRELNIEINPAELRIDTYRSSGAGGQHVNTTDSAVRITHLPSGVIVQCQNDRSQHKNKAQAMDMLRARLYRRLREEEDAEKRRLEENKDDIGWGSQIRSYVLDQSRIKDLRSGYESGNTRAVLNGELDGFVRAGLLWSAARAGGEVGGKPE